MTAALDVLTDIRRHGGDVRLIAPDRLRVLAPRPLLPDFTARVRDVKTDLLAMLAKGGSANSSGGNWDARDWQAYFEERAAIRQYDGGYSRPKAEELAWEDLLYAMERGYGSAWPSALTKIGIKPPVVGGGGAL